MIWRAFFLSWILCSSGEEPKVYIFLCTGLFISFLFVDAKIQNVYELHKYFVLKIHKWGEIYSFFLFRVGKRQ